MATENIIEWDEAAWRLDTEMLSPEARGIWREILGHLYLQNDRSGVITGTREEIARAGRCSAVQVDLAIKELALRRVADVSERNTVVTLVNRRMKREEIARKSCLLRVKKHRETGMKRQCNANGNAVVTLPPHTPLSKTDKERTEKALSSLSSLKRDTVPGAPLPNPKPETRNSKRLAPAYREIARRFEIVLGHQWPNDAGKWVNRIKAAPNKCERVVAEVESALKENRILETPAQYAEQIWKEFQ